VTPITVTNWPDEATRTPNSACTWVAETMVEGQIYTARTRHGAPNELARQLVAVGLADRPMVIHYRGRVGTMTYRSFHAAATWTYSEGDQPLRRVRYREQPEGVFLGSGTGQKCVSSPAHVPLEGRGADSPDIAAPAPASEMRFTTPDDGEECVSTRLADAREVPLIDGHETHPAEARRCEGCEVNFVPARPWSRFCSAACRLRAHRRLARQDEHVAFVVECPGRELG
jgi:hypothetical protein